MKYLSDKPCVICGKIPTALHHLKSRGSGGTDDAWNLLPLCGEHHNEIHYMGKHTFMKRHPKCAQELKYKGWVIGNAKFYYTGI